MRLPDPLSIDPSRIGRPTRQERPRARERKFSHDNQCKALAPSVPHFIEKSGQITKDGADEDRFQR
jgi:hypothetical protein